MKGVEDFLYILVAAVVILIVLAVFSLYYPPQPEVEYISIANFTTIGMVGFSTDYPARTENINAFIAGESQYETLKAVSLMRVVSGSEEQEFSIPVEQWLRSDLKRLTVSFTITDTNRYGNLIVKWNGKELLNEIRSGPITLSIEPGYVKSSNRLEISCSPPGWYFWAATTYVLRDFKVEADYGSTKIVIFSLLQSEIESLDRGEVSFYSIPSGQGSLVIKVNGIEVFNKAAEGITTVGFSYTDAPLRAGSNIISFTAQEGTFNLQNVKLQLFLLSNEIVRTRSFELTESQYKNMEEAKFKGKISYDIKKISRPGGITIKLNGNVLTTPSPAVGLNTVYFSSSEAIEGENTLIFTGTGSFEIGDLMIGLEKA